jgi:diacylglycerol kinase (ATP)
LGKNIDLYDNRVIICGGDGTVLWVIQEIAGAGIKFDNIIFGVIPIGTGNDFARSLGWGSKPITFSENNLGNLKKQILQWVAADVSDYDIWDC